MSEGVSILGSTGSVGESTLDVIRRNGDRFRVIALTANRNVERLAEQCAEHDARYAVIADESLAGALTTELQARGSRARVLAGPEGLCAAADSPEADTVMAAIVGAAGLEPTLAAAKAGKKVLLANKESLVIAGPVFMRAAREGGARVLPVDSEHNAIFQALPGDFGRGLTATGVERIILTASGGPFLDVPADQLADITPEQACNHPNWDMGRKISVDSATLMNKGLELIEAHWLFTADPDQLEVVVHPQSIVHSMVAYRDGSVLAQLGTPDMRTPIAYALSWPERIEAGVKRLNLVELGDLSFRAPDLKRFPCLRLAFEAMREGGSAPVTLNAANEIAVEAFLDGRIGFDRIPALVEAVLEQAEGGPLNDLEQVLHQDSLARTRARELMQEYT
ncbi:1-deoxy-D-xylulose-5-phosphate reductoisomerase [Elongatibacter sediminis]|uniref:1-deoxy-D-xylulose 5-phosphate reductoisomerase n=1 Tax=Elongatibacter sediminis TaxID=3119006 RepID=A0AAW9RB05_9GAMM